MPIVDPVPPEVIHQALQRMRNAARGNGINPHSITLNGCTGATLDFAGQSLFEIKSTVFEKLIPGREKGEVCTSAADLQNKIRTATENITIDTGIIDYATTFLERRSDKGFMAENLALKFDRLNRKLVFYNACGNCAGGKTACPACRGNGAIACPRCHGQHTMTCPQCRGARQMRAQDGRMIQCTKCHGQGRTGCAACHATGRIKCKTCQGSGRTDCPRCHATGVISTVANVSFEARTRFTYDRDTIPPEVAKLIDQTGGAMVTSNHADIRILHEQDQKLAQKSYEVSEKPKLRSQLAVPFQIRLPWATIGFRVGDRSIDGKLFGLYPRLLNLPSFLEQPIASGLERLTQAAQGHGSVSGNIEEAVKFRIIADAMITAAQMPPKKAIALMRKRWPLGIDDAVTDRMTLLAAKAYNNISKRPRWTGMAAGLALSVLIDAAYIAGPLRAMLPGLGVPSMAMMAVDIAVIAATGFLSAAASRFAARHALRSLFRPLLRAEKLEKIRTRAGSVSVYAYAGAVIVFLGVVAVCFYTGQRVPEWVGLMLQSMPR